MYKLLITALLFSATIVPSATKEEIAEAAHSCHARTPSPIRRDPSPVQTPRSKTPERNDKR